MTKQEHRPHQGRTRFDPQKIKTPRRPLEQIPKALAALALLDLFGALTGGQIARSIYNGRPTEKGHLRGLVAAERAVNQMTLRPLKDLGLVEVVPHARESFDPRNRLSPFVYWELNVLTAKGARALADWQVGQGLPAATFWEAGHKGRVISWSAHDLEIVNAGATLAGYAGLDGYVIGDWLRDRDFRSLAADGAFVPFLEPDAALTLHKDDVAYPFFVEIDRGTTPAARPARLPADAHDNSWQTKMDSYARYLRDYYRLAPFFATPTLPRVLVVTTNAARLEAIRAATRQAKGRDTYLFTLRSSLDPLAEPILDERGKSVKDAKGRPKVKKRDVNVLGAIWHTPDSERPVALRDYLRPRVA